MPEISKTSAFHSAGTLPWIKIACILAIVFTYLFGLDIPLVGPDEPRYAQVAREMFVRGDLITPTLGGFTWFEKPALLYWLEMAAFSLFGVSEFSARLGSALFGLGTIACVYFMARVRRAGGDDEPHGRLRFAEWAAIIAASTLGMIVFSRGATFDIILTFPITASIAGFYLFGRARNAREENLGLVAFYFFIGVALIAKGLVGIVFPFGIVTWFYIFSWRRPSRKLLLSLAWGTVLAVAVALVWYGPMYAVNGYKFIDEFFIQHHFQRYTTNKYYHPQSVYFFLWVFPLLTLPWLPFFAAALWKNLKNFTVENRREPRAEMFMLAAAWIVVPVAFFSLSGSKLPGYVLPSLPAAVLIAADYIFEFVGRRSRFAVWIKSAAAVTLAATVIAAATIVPKFADTDSVKKMMAAADAKGYAAAPVVCMHVISNNAEFYAAGRILRAPDGTLKKLLGPYEVKTEIENRNGAPLLVLVPLEYLSQLTTADYLNADVIGDNGETAVVGVTLRQPSGEIRPPA